MNKRTIGTEYETMAARYLCTHDYTILARNYRTPFGEVDLIAQKDGVLVYVEVKYRSSNDYGDPLEAVTGESSARSVRLQIIIMQDMQQGRRWTAVLM